MQELNSNTLTAWITALATFVALFSAFFVLKTVVARRAQRSAVPPSHLQELYRDLVKRTRSYFILLVSLWAGSLALTLNPHHEHIWHLVVMIGVLLQAGLWAGGLVLFWSERIADHREAVSAVADAARGCLASKA